VEGTYLHTRFSLPATGILLKTPQVPSMAHTRAIVASILAGVFDDKLCSEVERNATESEAVLQVC
jgi:hypothetical protein